ncbi:lachesin-like [Pollicipes pollicipes]|uniref:lachesin-like n=1 Tax=Pollicipes pollicipes TaxID=41117 RepID=UPI00188514A0|nr:lachesin-like [Pollicipes pollicipes]
MVGTAFIILAATATLVTSQRNPSISYISEDTTADIGGTAELKCSVQFAGTYPVIWIKKAGSSGIGGNSKDVIISTKSILIARESRFALRHDPGSSTYTLQISDIQETDQATYECRCQINLQTSVSGTVRLSVRLPPVISDNSTRSVIASEKERVVLSCYATGFPPPEITWRRDNNALLPTGSSIYRGNVLIIHNIKKEDRGMYYCVATNGVSKGSKRNVAVEVEFPPVINVPRPKVHQALQYDMDLECLVEAYPAPRITWLKDDIVLNNNQHNKMSDFTTTDQTTDSTLRVLSVERKQYGSYTCRASNRLGIAEAQLQLLETYSPVCPPACNASAASRLVLSAGALAAALVAALAAALAARPAARR